MEPADILPVRGSSVELSAIWKPRLKKYQQLLKKNAWSDWGGGS